MAHSHPTASDLRLNHVPRFLFRVWSQHSGGGRSVCVNDTRCIVPASYVKYPKANHDIYNQKEAVIQRLVASHYHGHKDIYTQFSSWAASLHAVLCYAQALKGRCKWNLHIAVMDTRTLDGDVKVWHVPHLYQGQNHEYLAHGTIQGRGYRAVPLQDLEDSGLNFVFPECYHDFQETFGCDLRRAMFKRRPEALGPDQTAAIRDVASHFGHLSLPVALALICIRPLRWVQKSKLLRNKIPMYQLQEILEGLGHPHVPPELANEAWLMKLHMVDCGNFKDVEQWIHLLRAIVVHTHGCRQSQVETSLSSTPSGKKQDTLKTKASWKEQEDAEPGKASNTYVSKDVLSRA